MSKPPFRPHDAVSFKLEGNEEEGFIASIRSGTASVVLNDGREFRVPMSFLRKREGVAPQRVRTQNDIARMGFKIHDLVTFVDQQSELHEGRIVKVNPKYARVRCGDNTWRVGYKQLNHAGDSDRSADRRRRLQEIEAEADALLKKHGLNQWCFAFDQASRRGGACFHSAQRISVAEQFALTAPVAEVTDTLLHEIAHALVGKSEGHGSKWRETALRIGCSARVTHDISFAGAKWIATCLTCKWRSPRQRRRRNLVCSQCRRPVKFLPFASSAEFAEAAESSQA